jgi:hypothetical protein
MCMSVRDRELIFLRMINRTQTSKRVLLFTFVAKSLNRKILEYDG